MDFIGSLDGLNNEKGITLNNQQIDLFNIIEKAQNQEEAIQKINEYLTDILQVYKTSERFSTQNLSTFNKIKIIVEENAKYVANKEEFIKFLLKNVKQIKENWDKKENLKTIFENQKVDIAYIEEIINIKKYFIYQDPKILNFLVDSNAKTINIKSNEINIDKEKTFQKVQAIHNYIIGILQNGKNRFARLSLDGQGSFKTVAGTMNIEKETHAKPEYYNLERLRQGYEFAKTNRMSEVYIGSIVFFKDFPDRLVGGTKEQYKTALINYGKAIASVAEEYETKGIHTVADIFNGLVDCNAPYSERTNNWMSKLNIEDLCEIAEVIKKSMPNASLGYSDSNFENSDKRKQIFRVINKIQAYEKENKCKILDYIGFQCHTSINDIDDLRQSIKDLQQFKLPIDITELDISKELEGINIYGKDNKSTKTIDYKRVTPEELTAIRKYEQKLQNDILKLISEFVKTEKIRNINFWHLTDELYYDTCDKEESPVNRMSYDREKGFIFMDKDTETQIEITEKDIQLIREHKSRTRKNNIIEINQNPIQDFCFHTHTSRCGHGAKKSEDEEWVKKAIKGGLKKLAFTDHVPLPDGYNKLPNSRMDIREVESYIKSINYLQKKYEGKIEIESGFEFEYSDRDLAHLQLLKTKTDKMILGQHFVIDKEGREYVIARGKDGKQISDTVLEMYMTSILSAIDKKIPDVIAHPDFFMKARDNFSVKEEEITRIICKKAIENAIPLEINFGEIASKMDSTISIEDLKKRIPYPSQQFWKIVAEETIKAKDKGKTLLVIYGKDAHYPEQLSTEKDFELAKEIIGEQILQQLNIITSYKKLEDIRNEILQKNE